MRLARSIVLTFLTFVLASTACSFSGSAIAAVDGATDVGPGSGSNAPPDASTDADTTPPSGTIVCRLDVVNGVSVHALQLGGNVGSGLLGGAPTSDPSKLAYKSDTDTPDRVASCPDLHAVPYPNGCTKPLFDWGATPTLYLPAAVDHVTPCVIYADGSVRCADFRTNDGDGVGFTVSGSGVGYDCRLVLKSDGSDGSVFISP